MRALQDANPVCGFFEGRCQVPGTRYRVPAIWHLDLVPGTGAGPTPRTERRAPKIEPGYWETRTPGMQGRGGGP